MADDDLRAVRRLGQIMAEQKATVGLLRLDGPPTELGV